MELGNLFWGVFGVAAWFAIPGVCLWFVYDGLRSGVVRVKLGSYSRSSDPKWYWGCIAMYGGLALFVFYLTFLFVLEGYRESWQIW